MLRAVVDKELGEEHRMLGGDDFHDHSISTAYTVDKAHDELHASVQSLDT